MTQQINIIGNKFKAKITYIRYCLSMQLLTHLIMHILNAMPATNIDGIALKDNKIKRLNILKNII